MQLGEALAKSPGGPSSCLAHVKACRCVTISARSPKPLSHSLSPSPSLSLSLSLSVSPLPDSLCLSSLSLFVSLSPSLPLSLSPSLCYGTAIVETVDYISCCFSGRYTKLCRQRFGASWAEGVNERELEQLVPDVPEAPTLDQMQLSVQQLAAAHSNNQAISSRIRTPTMASSKYFGARLIRDVCVCARVRAFLAADEAHEVDGLQHFPGVACDVMKVCRDPPSGIVAAFQRRPLAYHIVYASVSLCEVMCRLLQLLLQALADRVVSIAELLM